MSFEKLSISPLTVDGDDLPDQPLNLMLRGEMADVPMIVRRPGAPYRWGLDRLCIRRTKHASIDWAGRPRYL